MAERKAFKATKRKVERARREGRVLKSSYLTQFFVLLTGFALIWGQTGVIWVDFKMLLEYPVEVPEVQLSSLVWSASILIFQVVITFLGISAGVAILAEALQVGVLLETAPLSPKLSRLSPVAGFGRMFTGIKQVWEPMLKVMVIGSVGGVVLWEALPQMVNAQAGDLSVKFQFVQSLLPHLGIALLAAMVPLVALDYGLRWHTFHREQSMNHDEMRDEQKELEGSPLMRAVRRAMHERIAMQDLERRVRSAKVIVVRPSGPDPN